MHLIHCPVLGVATALIASAVLLPAPARATTCSVSPPSLTLGPYNPLETSSQDGVGDITVTCDVSTAFVITLGPGNGTYLTRKMVNGGQALTYNLFVDSAHTSIWGDGSNGTTTVSGNAKGGTIQVYGHVPGGQNLIKPGVYTDSILVTVTY